jgi:hypothetical protein
MTTLLNSSIKNINALTVKIQEQKQLLKHDKSNVYLKNIIKTNKNTLRFLLTNK